LPLGRSTTDKAGGEPTVRVFNASLTQVAWLARLARVSQAKPVGGRVR
jgi:hypothetical protein